MAIKQKDQGTYWEIVAEVGIMRAVRLYHAEVYIHESRRRIDFEIRDDEGKAKALFEVKSGEISDPQQIRDFIDEAVNTENKTLIIGHPDPEKVLTFLEEYPDVLPYAKEKEVRFFIKDMAPLEEIAREKLREQAEREAAERREVEQAERETTERREVEQAEREATERRGIEQAGRETAERHGIEQAEREATERREIEHAERETAERREVEQAERETTEQRGVEQAEREAAELKTTEQSEHESVQQGEQAAVEQEGSATEKGSPATETGFGFDGGSSFYGGGFRD